MRWSTQELGVEQPSTLPGLARLNNLVRTVKTPEFAGITFHEVLAKSALNKVPSQSSMPFEWTINPYRGCSHACVYCFARSTHRYLDLNTGEDFDNQLVVKVNVAEVLRAELGKSSWQRHPVALGTNTDPYQRAEGRYALMPGIIDALVEHHTPLSILTKGTLLRRDLSRIADAARVVPVNIALSIAIYDDELQQSIEPGTPTTAARLATVTAVREAGLDCSIFMMPILPFLTDTKAHLDDAMRQASASGASSVVYTSLHLRPGVREWFMQWLSENHPHLQPRYEQLYARSAYAPAEYRRWLAERVQPLMRAHGVQKGASSQATGGVAPARGAVRRAPAFAPAPAAPSPMLF